MASASPTPRRSEEIIRLLPGLALCAGIAVLAVLIGRGLPVLGSAVPAIVLGAVIGIVLRPGDRLRPGIAVAGRTVLQLAVVLLGSQLSITDAARVGLASLPVMIGTLVACLVGAWLIGRALGVVGNLRTLVGVGTGICGASAVAAVSPVIAAADAEIAYAISTVFVFNISAVIVFPVVGHLLGLGQQAFGLFAGTAVNDTSSVVAAATSYGSESTRHAVVVKLVRTLMIIPISLILGALAGRADRGDRIGDESRDRVHPTTSGSTAAPARVLWKVIRLVPPFLVGFVLLATARSAGLLPTAAVPALSQTAVLLITVAMAGVGLSTDLAALRRTGPRPLLLGGVLWVVVSLTSLGLQALSGTL